MNKKDINLTLLAILLVGGSCINPAVKEEVTDQARKEKIKWFTEARFGMFIHWAPSCIYGKEISWSRSGNPPDDWHSGGSIDSVLYDDSYKFFNPSGYNPKAWVKLARDAGMKYMVITTRHHDGFSMFDTKYSDFKITNPEGAYRKWVAEQNPSFTAKEINLRTDLIRQLADAAHEAGMGLGFYYSEPDWVREDYRIALTGKNFKGKPVSTEEQKIAEKTYQEFMHNQLAELTTEYGQVDLIWFDAIKPSQVRDGKMKAIWIQERTLDMIRKNQPGILINDRTGFTPDYVTNELRDTKYVPGLITESATKLGNPYWSYSPEGTSNSSQWIIDRLIINAGNNSNLLMNVGPGPDGEIPEIYVPQLLETGKWLNRYGEAFYGTRGGPFFDQDWGVSTFRGNKVFLFLRGFTDEELLLPAMNFRLLSATNYPDYKEIRFVQDRLGSIRIQLPESEKEFDTQVLVLEFNESLEATAQPAILKKKGAKPEIKKLGTIALHVVETTPFVFKNELYRLEWVRPENTYNAKGMSYLHIVEHKTGKEVSNFGERYRFPCAFVENNTVYVVGTYENLGWHGTLLTLFTSEDLKTWTSDTLYHADQELHQICNTSLCKSDTGYTLMFEISGTPEAGVGFTPRFLSSRDLKTFDLTPKECTYGRDRYAAPHCLRYYNGWYYNFYLEAGKPGGYEQYLVRSKDLINWESSPFNPVLSASREDRLVARKGLTEEELGAIAGAEDVNNSDIDFCEYQGKLVITYSWGNQQGKEFLAEAVYNGTMGQFLEGWFKE